MKNLAQRKKNNHTPSGYSLFTNCSFDARKNKPHCYKGEDCMRRCYEDLTDHATKIINYEEKEMIPLTDKVKSKKFVPYAKKNLVLMKMKKMHLNYTIKSEIIIIKLEN